MENINKLHYEVWYRYGNGDYTRRLAAFHFRFEAEEYVEMKSGSPFAESNQYYIVEV